MRVLTPERMREIERRAIEGYGIDGLLLMERAALALAEEVLSSRAGAGRPLRALLVLTEEQNVAVFSTEGRALVFNTALLAPKTSRATQGVAVMTLKPKFRLERAAFLADTTIQNLARYRMRSIPAAGALLREEDRGERQMTLLDGAEENTK